MSKKQKVGIVFDNYKTRKFKRAIAKGGFEFEIMPFKQGTTVMFIECEESKVKDIGKICAKCQIDIKLSN